MKFPRGTKPFSGQFDMTPFAGVLLLLLLFIALQRNIVLTPGLPIRLPEGVESAGTAGPSVVVAVAAGGEIFFENQLITEPALLQRLGERVRQSPQPLTLIVHADREVRYEKVLRLGALAREAGLKDAVLATRPKLVEQLSDR